MDSGYLCSEDILRLPGYALRRPFSHFALTSSWSVVQSLQARLVLDLGSIKDTILRTNKSGDWNSGGFRELEILQRIDRD